MWRISYADFEASGKGHHPSTYKRNIGSTPTLPKRPIYGAGVRCSCGWKFTTNEAPTKGGYNLCRDAWRAHVKEKMTDG